MHPPLILFETWWKEADQYARLADALGPTQPIIRIEAPTENMPARSADWVEFHLARFRELGVEPPYYLGGWSYGGLLALEVARKLRAEGHEIAFMGMIDVGRPILRPSKPIAFARYHVAEARDLPPQMRFAYLRDQVRHALGRIRDRRRRKLLPRTSPSDTLRYAVQRSYVRHRAVPYDATHVTIFTTESTIDVRADGDKSLRWASYLRGGYNLVPITGDHFTIFDDEHVGSIARALMNELAVARLRLEQRSYSSDDAEHLG